MNKKYINKLGLFSLLLSIPVIQNITAQESKIDSLLIEEVIVTAQKKEENIQDVGMAITALTGNQLKALGISSSLDIVAHTPGLEATGAGGGVGASTFAIRGVAQNDFSSPQESPVATYIDQSYIASASMTSFSLFDIDRVEILKGPQGTLFGRNATGGVVHFISKKPSQEKEGHFDITLADGGRKYLEFASGGSISDKVSGRLSVATNKSTGLIKNDIGPSLMAEDNVSIRGQLLFEHSDTSSTLFKVEDGEEDGNRGGYAMQISYGGTYGGGATDFFGYSPSNDVWKTSQDFPSYYDADLSNINIVHERAFSDTNFVYIFNSQDSDVAYGEDADVSPNSVYNYESFTGVDQTSHEFRWAWDNDNSRTVAGIYVLDIDLKNMTSQHGDAYFGAGYFYKLYANQKTSTTALFFQRDTDLNDNLSLITGIRFNSDDKDFNWADPDSGLLYTNSFSDDDVAWKIQLEKRPNDNLLLYGGISKGIKSGGYNAPLAPPEDFASMPYGSESLLSYEAGFKLDRESYRINGSIFMYDYEDYQAMQFDAFVPLIFNSGAEISGFELDITSNPSEGVDLVLGISHLDTEIIDLPTAVYPGGVSESVLSPKFSINAIARKSWMASSGGLFSAQVDMSWKASHVFNIVISPVVEEPSHAVFNTRITYIDPSDNYEASFFIKNLTDTEYRRYAFDTSAYFGATEDVWGEPRWAGINLLVRF
jgi:iron complex outermembrane receptor protein|tara:strand:- start:1413 stop:3542 length:2130 start_codon:yes stop_codon:yes gene_type:complete